MTKLGEHSSMEQSAGTLTPPAVGLAYASRLIASGPLCDLFYGDQRVTASRRTPFLAMTNSLVWTWLDGDEYSLRYPSSLHAELCLNEEPLYEIPYVGFCKGGEQFIWRRISDKLRLLTAELVREKCLQYEYRFYNQERAPLGTFKSQDLWNCRLGRRRPMPLYDFQGSLLELNLMWAFILLQQFCQPD